MSGLSRGSGLWNGNTGSWSGATGLQDGAGTTPVPANAVRDRATDLVKDRAAQNIFTRIAALAAVSSLAAIGSMTAGSDALALDSNPGFQVGNWVIVETGGEAGTGLRGTEGVGGAWPTLSYANVTAMNADTTQALNKMAWVKATGDTYYWNGSAWVQPAEGDYYNRKAVPKALVAQIEAVDGNTLTLNKAAAANATSANVYFDNWGVIQSLIAVGDVEIPSGTYHVSDHIYINRPNLTLSGAGKTATTLRTPNGASHGGVQVTSANNCVVKDMTIDCSFNENRYSFRWQDGRAVAIGSTNFMSDTYRNIGGTYGQGVHFSLSQNCVARNLRVIDVAQQALTTTFAFASFAYDCDVIVNEARPAYLQWMINWTDTNEGGVVDCTIDSNFLVAGFEAFKCRNTQITRVTSRNGLFSNNTSDGTVIDSPVITINDNAKGNSQISIGNPIMDFPVNAEGGFSTNTSMLINPTITQQGYFDGTNRLVNITVNAGTSPLSISGTYDTDPTTPKGLIDVQQPGIGGNSYGGMGIRNSGTVTVEGIRIKGLHEGSGFLNAIHSEGGTTTVTNSIFDPDTVSGTGTITQSGNQTNAEYGA